MSSEQEYESMLRLGDAARQAGISVQQLNYYLMVGVVIPSCISQGGQRLFCPKAIKRIKMVSLLNQSGYTLRDIREIFIESR